MNRLSPSRRLVLPSLVGVGLFALLATGYAFAAGFLVTLGATGPTPTVQTIAWGDTVTWSNADTASHVLDSSRGAFTSTAIPPGGAYTHTYTGASGNFSFREHGKKSYPGLIVVTLTGTVSMKASKPLVTFGKPVTLSGNSTVLASPVDIAERSSTGGSWVKLSTLTLGPDGAFSTQIVPKVGTRYRASAAAGQLNSSLVSVRVAPLVKVSAGATKAKTGAIVRVVVRVTPHVAAHTAELYAYSATRKRWVRAAAPVKLKDGVAIFRWAALPGRTLLRGWIANSDLEPGFSPGFSTQIAVTTPPLPPKTKRKH
jgi:plastocyanin